MSSVKHLPVIKAHDHPCSHAGFIWGVAELEWIKNRDSQWKNLLAEELASKSNLIAIADWEKVCAEIFQTNGKPDSINEIVSLEALIKVIRRLKDNLDRQHILEGRQIAFLRRDELLRLACSGDSLGELFISKLGLTRKQAKDILELKIEYFRPSNSREIETELASIRSELGGLCHDLSTRVISLFLAKMS